MKVNTVERTWRHLNFFQYKTFLHARVLKVRWNGKCPQVSVPWARKNSGFTLLFEAMVLEYAKHMTVSVLARLVDENDKRLWRIIKHANEAVDKVRKEEAKTNAILKKTKYIWLKNASNLTEHQRRKMESLSLKRLKTGMAYSMRVSLQDIYETCVDKTSDETKRFTDGRCYENRCNHLSCSPVRLRRQRLHSISFRFCQGWRSVYSEFPDTHYPLKSANNHNPFHMHLDFQLRV